MKHLNENSAQIELENFLTLIIPSTVSAQSSCPANCTNCCNPVHKSVDKTSTYAGDIITYEFALNNNGGNYTNFTFDDNITVG